jgi:septal ring factor EnvC (AmiA/AmiB activator)
VQQLSQRAGATAELAETVMGATQRLAQFEEAAAAEAIAVRQLLAATRDRIADLDAARAKDGAILARLQAELDAARAESERLEASRRGLEELFQFYKEAMDTALSGGPAAAVADLPSVGAAQAEERGPAGCTSTTCTGRIPPSPDNRRSAGSP